MTNFSGFVRFNEPIRPKSTRSELIVAGQTQTPFAGSNVVRFKFAGKLYESLMKHVSHEKCAYMQIKGWLVTRDWQDVFEGGTTINGTDCMIVVTEFEIISGKKEAKEGVIVRKHENDHHSEHHPGEGV